MRLEKNKPLSVLCGLWLAATILGLTAHRFSPSILRPALLEALLIFALMFTFFNLPPVMRFIFSLPKPLKIFSAVFFFLLLAGQAISINTASFPFVSWSMYAQTDPGPIARFIECRGVLRSGARVVLSAERLYPSVRKNMLGASISRHSRAFESDLGPLEDKKVLRAGILGRLNDFLRPYPKLGKDEMKKRMGEIFEALAHKYNSAHPGDPIMAVELVRGNVNIDDTPDPRPVYEIMAVYDLAERRFR
jgi:hypothetical protein